MTINLYKIAKDNRVCDKISGASPINLTPISVQPTELVNLISPVFELAYEASYLTANYLYCDTYDRSYYITEARVNTAQRIELVCVVDVRQSFSTAIKATECTIIRAESIAAPTKIIDTKLPVNPSTKIITSIVLPETTQTFDTDASYSYLLTVVGGEPTITP